MAVDEFDVVGECLEAVGETLRDEQRAVVAGGKHFAMPTQEGRRTGADVYRHVEDLAAQATHQFHFGVWRALEMQAAHRALAGRKGVVDLRDGVGPAGSAQLLGAEQPRKEAALVGEPQPLDALEAGERQGGDGEAAHASAS